MKQMKYRNLTRCLLAVLPGWTTDIVIFTVGVKGFVDTVKWRIALDAVGIPPGPSCTSSGNGDFESLRWYRHDYTGSSSSV